MPYTRPYTGGFKDYPDTTTPINATALNTMDVGIKTANDQFQTVTTAQRTALSPTVGQAVWDSDLKQLMVYMNASGGNAWQPVGNQVVCASTTRPATPFKGQMIFETDTNKTLVYNGTTWFEISDLDNTGGISDATNNAIKRLGFVTRTTNYVTASTTVAGAANMFSSSITWTAAGSTAYRIEFNAPYVQTAATANANLFANLVDGSGNDLGYLGSVGRGNGTYVIEGSIFSVYYYTPAAGSATINVRAIHGVAAGTFAAGAGGAGAGTPISLAVFGPGLT